jgi:hypothetical protein
MQPLPFLRLGSGHGRVWICQQQVGAGVLQDLAEASDLVGDACSPQAAPELRLVRGDHRLARGGHDLFEHF